MWRIVLETSRLPAERAAQKLDEALVPEVMALSLFETANPGLWRVEGIYDEERDARAALEVLCDDNRLMADVTPLPQEDWVARSLEGLPPVRAGRFLVHGEHNASAGRSGDITLQIEAGVAFGTGHHGTTQGCLDMIGRLARTRRFENALDVGSGTGVLALAVAKRFRIPVIASDLDDDAVEMTRENARLNGCGPWVTALAAPGTRHGRLREAGPFDLVMANILMQPLLALSGDLACEVAPGGVLVLSGLLVSQELRVLNAYRARGLVLVDRLHMEGWSTLALSRPPH